MGRIIFILSLLISALVVQAQTNLDSLYAVWQDSSRENSVRLKAYNRYFNEGFLYCALIQRFFPSKHSNRFHQMLIGFNLSLNVWNDWTFIQSIRGFFITKKFENNSYQLRFSKSSKHFFDSIYVFVFCRVPRSSCDFGDSICDVGGKQGADKMRARVGMLWRMSLSCMLVSHAKPWL